MVIRIRTLTGYNGRNVGGDLIKSKWRGSIYDGSTKVIQDWFQVPANSLNEAISINTAIDTVKYIYIEDPNNSGKLSIKINGSSNPTSVSPRILLSEALTSLTVTNTDTSNPQQLRIIYILIEPQV